ncbi:MAG: glutamate--tRNA ligase [Clostridiaceae bacterium]|nr:glutamate--tRNA ligase [Clostridiaceae bacterium]
MTDRRVRTRFAPSPTGYMHVGNLRTAIFEYLVAKSQGGDFILRIEDTDQERIVEGSLEIIYQTLETVGLRHDEGPDIGGAYGPYIQSERLELYLPYAEQLVEAGHAYYCFCSQERLRSLRDSDQLGYDRHCRDIPPEEARRRVAAGESWVIRQKMPTSGVTGFTDEVFGYIEVSNTELEDQILIKSDGFPTYNFANVIDDHTMKITHVVRGSEYLSSTPKYQLLYEAFGFESPVYIHLPLILGSDRLKLSKRHGATGFQDLVEEGYLPEAIINYLALLGWSPGDEREIFSLSDLERSFTISGINKAPAVFDYDKLNWFNSTYIKAMSHEDLRETLRPYIDASIGLKRPYDDAPWDLEIISEMLRARLERLTDAGTGLAFLRELPPHDTELYFHKKMKTSPEQSLDILERLRPSLAVLDDWSTGGIYAFLTDFARRNEIKNGQVMWPCRIACTNTQVTPGGAVEIMALLGREESLRRIDSATINLRTARNTEGEKDGSSHYN